MLIAGTVPFRPYTVDRFKTDAQLDAERLTFMRKYMRNEPDASSHKETSAALKIYDQTLGRLLKGSTNPQETLVTLLSENALETWGTGHSKSELNGLKPACDALKMAFTRCAVKGWNNLGQAYESSRRIWSDARPDLEAAVAALEAALELSASAGNLGDRLVQVAKALRIPLETGAYPDGLTKSLILNLAGPLVDLICCDAGSTTEMKRHFAFRPAPEVVGRTWGGSY